MGLKSLVIKPVSGYIHKQISRDARNAVAIQERWLKKLVTKAKDTAFGKEHGFAYIRSYHDFRRRVPLRSYEQLRPYINRIVKGENDVLWPKRPLYFAKTSGTTSGVKYIPITKDSVSNHFGTARNALLMYAHETGNLQFFDGKLIFLSGSPILTKVGNISTGRLSGIVNHHIPAWLRTNQLPSYKTNCIDDWETKLEHIVSETINQDMRLISGIPPWMQMYFDRLEEKSGQKMKDLFPNFSVLVHGGVNYEPYRQKLEQSIGKKIDSVETYPASEGFIAFQNTQYDEGLLLNTNSGIYFEFVPANEIFDANPTRLNLADVQVGVNYAIIMSTNAGLWAYNIGDTVKFVSLNPYKIVVTGRIKHFISAFGEHVIVEEVETSLQAVAQKHEATIIEFTVAPMMHNTEGQPYHEWFIEFDEMPKNLRTFALELDMLMQQKNIYYADLVQGNILQHLKITPVGKGAFQNYMKSIGKLGGQNKVPHLSNDRRMATVLEKFKLK